jgi:osmoprotectant transport system ATP-binding protein
VPDMTQPTNSAQPPLDTSPVKLLGDASEMTEIATTTSVTTVRNTSGARIQLQDVTKVYPNQPVPAVENFSMDINPGELIMFVGPSGCGKTTTMKMINRIIEPTAGSIQIDGNEVLSLNPNDLRRHIGYVIQQVGLFPHMTIAENIAVVPKLLGWSKTRISSRIDELLSVVQLDPGTFAQRYPKQLSGGQQQRVGVARALAADPPVMLMDEPFGATDPITREKLQLEFLRLQKTIGKTIIFVTHDFEEAVRLGDRIAVLSDRSQIEQFDTPAAILRSPANDYVASFIGRGAALKRLALVPVSAARLGSARTATGSVTVSLNDTLRDALDGLVLTGVPAIGVTDSNGATVGSISIAEISQVLGADAHDAITHPAPSAAPASKER